MVSIMSHKGIRNKLGAEPYCIRTCGQLRDFFSNKPARWRAFVRSTPGIGEEKFVKAINAAKDCLQGEPTVIDYRKAINPYAARYKKEWEQHVYDTPQMKCLTNVQELVTHIVETGIKRREGTNTKETGISAMTPYPS